MPYRLTAPEGGVRERAGYSRAMRVQAVRTGLFAHPFELKIGTGADGRFSAVVCFTMLHHVPSPQLQDRLLAEVSRVLRAGGVFAGTDSVGTGRAFKLLHVRDTLVPVAPDGLPARMERAGLAEASVRVGGSSFRFRARKPAEASTA